MGYASNIFWSHVGIARLQVGDGSTKGIPAGLGAAFTDMGNVLKVRRAFSELHYAMDGEMLAGERGSQISRFILSQTERSVRLEGLITFRDRRHIGWSDSI